MAQFKRNAHKLGAQILQGTSGWRVAVAGQRTNAKALTAEKRRDDTPALFAGRSDDCDEWFLMLHHGYLRSLSPAPALNSDQIAIDPLRSIQDGVADGTMRHYSLSSDIIVPLYG